MARRSKSEQKKLTLLESQFVKLLTDPTRPGTYLRPYHAYKEIRPDTAESTKRDAPYRMIKKDRVKNAIEQEMDRHNFGKGKRSEILAAIGRGDLRIQRQIVTKDGRIIETEVEPSMADRIKAIETANRMDGSYEQQKLDADIAREEHKRIEDELLKDVRNVSPKKK